MKKKYWLMTVLGCICLGIASFYIGNYFSGGTILNEPADIDSRTLQNQLQPSLHEQEEHSDIALDIYAQEDLPQDQVRRSTRLIFEHYNEWDGTVSRTETIAPHFLIGMNREDLLRYYDGFEVGYFSDEQVIMRRDVQRPVIESFTLGVVDGFLAVFNGTEMLEEYLKEITSTLVAPLARDDRERLQQGITVRGQENLFNILQDYGS